MNIILDSDNTMGLPACDSDDGLALLYLLGAGVKPLGITCSFGNSDQEKVYHNTKRLLGHLEPSIPVLRGGNSPGDRSSEAADFLVEKSREVKDLHLLVTGSTTNLYQAFLQDPTFFTRISSVTLMGGLESDFYLDELNFSVDHEATYHVLKHARNITIATANEAFKSEFDPSEFVKMVSSYEEPLKEFILKETTPWQEEHQRLWPAIGIINWDLLAAVALVQPEVITLEERVISPTMHSLETGRLHDGGELISISVPRITCDRVYRQHVYETYEKVRL